MTFNENARIDTSKVSKRSRGKTGGAIAGGGIGLALLLYLGSQLLGVDLTGLASGFQQGASGSASGGSQSEEVALTDCETGADANANAECRMAATADILDQYWAGQVEGYRSPQKTALYEGQTESPCGTASAQTGPFYCPTDERIYLDVAFFDTLRSNYGASSGSLAEMYVLSHEWGHHISNLIGTLNQADRASGATSGSVRLELQADCFAGAWVGEASTVEDSEGQTFLKPVTDAEIDDALSAAAAVGDDHIMEAAGGQVNPDNFTHGTSEQRQKWFMEGYRGGPNACSTFEAADSEL